VARAACPRAGSRPRTPAPRLHDGLLAMRDRGELRSEADLDELSFARA
jgi:hypothetical protein